MRKLITHAATHTRSNFFQYNSLRERLAFSLLDFGYKHHTPPPFNKTYTQTKKDLSIYINFGYIIAIVSSMISPATHVRRSLGEGWMWAGRLKPKIHQIPHFNKPRFFPKNDALRRPEFPRDLIQNCLFPLKNRTTKWYDSDVTLYYTWLLVYPLFATCYLLHANLKHLRFILSLSKHLT